MKTIFIKCRFTNTEKPFWFDGENFLCLGDLDVFLQQYGKIVKRTYGQEQASRMHIHIHYELQQSAEHKNIPKVIHQTFIYYLKSKKGYKDNPPSKSSSITTNDTEKEPDRILRYPLKQDDSHYSLSLGYTKAEFYALHARANEEYRIAVKNQQTRQDKKDKEEATWNALCDYVDKHLADWELDQYGDTPNVAQKVRKVTVCIYKYYMEHKGSQVSRNLRDKGLRYLLIRGHVTNPDEIYDFYHVNSNY